MADEQWSADDARSWNEREHAVYETGHREGESCRQADWFIALTEYCELPDDVDHESPTQVAEYIAKLQSELAEHISATNAVDHLSRRVTQVKAENARMGAQLAAVEKWMAHAEKHYGPSICTELRGAMAGAQ